MYHSLEILLPISFTVNGCTLMFLFVSKLLSCFLKKMSKKEKQTMFDPREVTGKVQAIVSKILVEQLVTWSLFVVGIFLLAKTDVFQKPFFSANHSELIITVFAINIGKYIFRSIIELHLNKVSPLSLVSQLHHLVVILTYSIMIDYQQNQLLGILGLFMEGSCICSEAFSVLKNKGSKCHKNILLVMAGVNFASTLLFRILIPIAVVIAGLFQQSPLSMSPIPLAMFFATLIFFAVFNGWLLRNTVQNAQKAMKQRQEVGNQFFSEKGKLVPETQVFCVKNKIDYLRPCSNVNLDVQGTFSYHNNIGKAVEKTKVTDVLDVVQTSTWPYHIIGNNPPNDVSPVHQTPFNQRAPYLAHLLASGLYRRSTEISASNSLHTSDNSFTHIPACIPSNQVSASFDNQDGVQDISTGSHVMHISQTL